MDQMGRKRHCTGCNATYFDFNRPEEGCPGCGKPPTPRVGPSRRRSIRAPLRPPQELLASVIDDECELLGEDSLDGSTLKTAGITISPGGHP